MAQPGVEQPLQFVGQRQRRGGCALRQRSRVPAAAIGSGSPLTPPPWSSTCGAWRSVQAACARRASCISRTKTSRASSACSSVLCMIWKRPRLRSTPPSAPAFAAAVASQRSAAPASLSSWPGNCGRSQVSASSRPPARSAPAPARPTSHRPEVAAGALPRQHPRRLVRASGEQRPPPCRAIDGASRQTLNGRLVGLWLGGGCSGRLVGQGGAHGRPLCS